MTAADAVAALERLGLSSYEAQVFVALQRLGTGTAEAVCDVSGVPRSQVYGAAEDLADRGLVELVESSPERYRPVDLGAARRQLTARLERETAEAFDALRAVRGDHADQDGEGVTTLRGRHAVDQRVRSLLARADAVVVFAPAAWAIDAVADRLRDLADGDVAVSVASEDPAVGARFEDDPVRAFVVEGDQMGEMTGRPLLVDEATVLLSVVDPDRDGADETAPWTADTSIGRILAEFVHTGMEAALDR